RFSRDWSSDVCSSDLLHRAVEPWQYRTLLQLRQSGSRTRDLCHAAVRPWPARLSGQAPQEDEVHRELTKSEGSPSLFSAWIACMGVMPAEPAHPRLGARF